LTLNNELEVVGMAKILILDEYPSIRNLLAEELAGEGNVVLSTGKPEIILEEIAAFNPDVAIFDIFMKGKYWWGLLEEVKNQNPDLPIIIYSGYYPKGNPHLNRIEGFIMKSFDLHELKQCISEVLMRPGLAASRGYPLLLDTGIRKGFEKRSLG
jgi:DNA-binding NtrC family response regulator